MTTTKTKTAIEAARNMGCSPELVDGLRRYAERIDSLGGYGTAVAAAMPNGSIVTGELIELGSGLCQPGIRTKDGKRYAIVDMDSIRVV